MFGHDGHPDRRDMSDFLVHFVGRGLDHDERFDRLVQIVNDGELRAGDQGVGLGKGLSNPVPQQRCVCLSEIPLDRLSRLVDRHGDFGVAFARDWVRTNGGNRVWYVDAGSDAHDVMMKVKSDLMQPKYWDHSLWKVMRYIDEVVRTDERLHYWDWEREWRVAERLAFSSENVRFLFAPAPYHERIHARLGDHHRLLDPGWDAERIEKAARPLL